MCTSRFKPENFHGPGRPGGRDSMEVAGLGPEAPIAFLAASRGISAALGGDSFLSVLAY